MSLENQILAELDNHPEGFPVSGRYLAQKLSSTYDDVLTAVRKLETSSRFDDRYTVITTNQRDDRSDYPKEFYVHLTKDKPRDPNP
ncbi:hypothetical protein A5742_21310 [Mycolicibacterium fortuitum]|uniref:Uncharacterized protein n=1 Tax=Mycolicibacterium fortuitum TaxID=1766 RepID=A0ABD6QQN5_MYCFO|nr:hypothetical protein [Mycolicibacterium fortuitum]OMC49291.1 hypothetical protein A5742_21310 [Mycolicibacterium fortuitum]